MDFHLTKEQLLVQKMYREFAENEVKPLATEIDEEERFPMETVEKMAKPVSYTHLSLPRSVFRRCSTKSRNSCQIWVVSIRCPFSFAPQTLLQGQSLQTWVAPVSYTHLIRPQMTARSANIR